MACEHSFARYIRKLGRDRKLGSSLTQEEAYAAMTDIACYEVEPQQLGAFLMLLRLKRKTPAEIAGFAQALQENLPAPADLPPVAVNWAAYAGKRRQPPWFLLAALLLGRNGYPVFMHGLSRRDEKVYVPQALRALGIESCSLLSQAAARIRQEGFAYLPIEKLSGIVEELIGYRKQLGLRTPMHSIARMLNPLSASLMLQGVNHAEYAPIYQGAASLLKQGNSLSIQGDSGEFERILGKPCKLYGLSDGICWEEEWPAEELFEEKPILKNQDLEHFAAVWEGREDDEYGRAAVIGTLAIVLRGLGRVTERDAAYQLAEQWWLARNVEAAA